MASQEKGRPLPKFGEWDVNNPASAEGFTVIFNKARDNKKTVKAQGGMNPQKTGSCERRESAKYKGDDRPQHHQKKKWFCCG